MRIPSPTVASPCLRNFLHPAPHLRNAGDAWARRQYLTSVHPALMERNVDGVPCVDVTSSVRLPPPLCPLPYLYVCLPTSVPACLELPVIRQSSSMTQGQSLSYSFFVSLMSLSHTHTLPVSLSCSVSVCLSLSHKQSRTLPLSVYLSVIVCLCLSVSSSHSFSLCLCL